MSIIPVGCLSSKDLSELGNNVLPEVRRDHEELHAVNRSLAVHREQVPRLHRRGAVSVPRTQAKRSRAA
jgi:hypothetical protein